MKNKYVIYTALFGDYDDLIEPEGIFKGCDLICFTDQKHIKSNHWDIIYIDNGELPPNIMNRKYKILTHLYLGNYNQSLYIDSNIRLLSNPFYLFEKYLDIYSIAVPKHTSRKCIYQEAKKCLKYNLVEKNLVNQQMKYYMDQGYPQNNGLAEMNIIFRKHNDKEIISLMNDWWKELNEFTKRDQLSFNYVVWKNNILIKIIEESSRRFNKYFFAECHKHEKIIKKNKRQITKLFYKFKLKFS